MDNSAPATTGLWTIIDHFTGEMIVDDEEVPPGVPSDSMIQIEVVMGLPTLIQTQQLALLFADQDERSDWLIRATTEFLQHVPYYLCFNDIVDLFFTQEVRLSHPDKVSTFYFPLSSLADKIFHYPPVHSPCSTIRKEASRSCCVYEKRMGLLTRCRAWIW